MEHTPESIDSTKNLPSSREQLRKLAIIVVSLTAFLLIIPLVAMQFTEQVNWNVFDFLVMGIMLLLFGSLLAFASIKIKKNKFLTILIILLSFLYIWAELAVGIFTQLGS